MRFAFPAVILFLFSSAVTSSQTVDKPKPTGHPVSISVFDRTRVDSWQWFSAPPYTDTYGYVESLVRIGISQNLKRWDWQLEVSQPAILDAPSHAVSPVAAVGQLGLGASYYASNGNNDYPAAAFFKQGFARYHFNSGTNLRAGRFEFIEGQETKPADPEIQWLQANRIAHRLIGNFAFSDAQRSVDGVDAHYESGPWNLTGMAARVDQGVFNMNGNPELNVDVEYLGLTRSAARGHVLARAFGIGYHDGRTGITKTDNRSLAVRQADHKNIRLGTYGGDLLAVIPAGKSSFDFLFWGALQNGNWGKQGDSAGAVALEGGYRMGGISSAPWLRAGWFRSTGDNHPTDNTHNTFFQILPTPRIYARTPFYNLMNSTDEFVQVIDKPSKKLELRSDLHGLRLTSPNDLWYLGGGAYDNSVFGYTGRPANGHSSFASFLDASADWQASKSLALGFYYGHAWGKTVPAAIYPQNRNLQYGYVEAVYRWGTSLGGTKK